jgi:multimeric flavodoxin WrbA
MKSIAIIGSPNKNGSCSHLVEQLNQGMKSQGIDASTFYLHDMDIKYCKGCRQCEEKRECVQLDDMKLLIDEIFVSDIIVLASPSYWGDVTGPMKVFIDRSLPLCNAATGVTPVPTGKKGISISVRDGFSTDENQHIISTFDHYFGHLEIDHISNISVEGINTVNDLKLRKDKLYEAFKIGESIKFF